MKAARFDYHIHESYSSDARDSTVEQYIQAAEKKGIEEIAFTTHQIITGPDSYFGVQPEELQSYVDNILRFDETTDVKLLVGLEVDYFPKEERALEKLIDEHPFDLILGSTHYVGEYDVGSRRDAAIFFSGRSLLEATSKYHLIWRSAIESGLFDIMAHPDYWRRFLYLSRPEPARFAEYGMVEEAIDSLISYDVGIEVNTSGKRHKHNDQYPVKEFLEATHKAGLDKITLGSDSHIPEHLGLGLPEAVEMLKDIGFKYISSYKNRRNISHPIDSMVRTVKNM
jgi:histidinol-phosphatase (PHP family)